MLNFFGPAILGRNDPGIESRRVRIAKYPETATLEGDVQSPAPALSPQTQPCQYWRNHATRYSNFVRRADASDDECGQRGTQYLNHNFSALAAPAAPHRPRCPRKPLPPSPHLRPNCQIHAYSIVFGGVETRGNRSGLVDSGALATAQARLSEDFAGAHLRNDRTLPVHATPGH